MATLEFNVQSGVTEQLIIQHGGFQTALEEPPSGPFEGWGEIGMGTAMT